MIEQAVIQALLGTPAFTGARGTAQAAVVAAVNGSVFPAKAPQGKANPKIVVAREGAEHTKHLLGRSGLAKTKVRVEVYAALYKDADALADNVRQTLDGYRGTLANGLRCQGVFLDDDPSSWLQPAHADEQGVQAVELHFKVVAPET